MSFPDNYIGPHQFLRLEAPFQPPREEPMLQKRMGVDGIIAWLTGKRGQPFPARTFVDQPTLPAAINAYAAYLELVGQGAQVFVMSDIDMTPLFGVLVLDVRIVEAKWVGAATWGLNPPSFATLECDWDLVAVEV